MGHLLQPDDAAAGRLAQPRHLIEQRRRAHQLVGQQHGERLVADRLPGAADGVTEAERLVLIGEADPHVAADRLEPVGHRRRGP